MRSTPLAIASVLTLLACPTVLAQTTTSKLSPSVSVSRRYSPPEAAHHHSSTAYEGARRGEAAAVSAYGDFLQDYSQAAYTWEHVESLRYDNQLKKTATALTRKRMIADYREQERQLKRNRREAAKDLLYEKDLQLAEKYRLDEYELNWTTGTIYWPTVVAGPRFASHRQRLDILMHRFALYGESSSKRYQDEITKACSEFRKQLLETAELDHPSAHQEYVAMQRFLQGLRYTPLLMAQAPVDELLSQN